jgi:protease IV
VQLTGLKKIFVTLKTMVALPSERIRHGSVLKINLHGEISDQLTNGMFITLPQLRDSLLKAVYDPRISAIYLHISNLNCGWAMLDEIRREILNFKKSGKIIIAYLFPNFSFAYR